MWAALDSSARRRRKFFGYSALWLCLAFGGGTAALAHTTNQAFVLLLPTNLYTAAGVVAVALSILVLASLPPWASGRVFTARPLFHHLSSGAIPTLTSLVSLGLLISLIHAGYTASRDPLSNPLPLFIWTVWWVGFVTLQGIFGDLWRWVNPWSGLHWLFCKIRHDAPFLKMPDAIGSWPGVAAFIGFGLFTLADLAPSDPARLATAVALYWLYTFVGMTLFGQEIWLGRCECFTMLLRHFSKLSVLGVTAGTLRIGAPGWRVIKTSALSSSGALFVIIILGTGSFDGLNDTFWWLGTIGINPLEFPGRSAVVWQTIAGLIAANTALAAIFAASVWLGLRLAKADVPFREAFGKLVLAILPIALGYHVAHYLTAFLVQGQYGLAAASDPWSNGADYLGLGGFHVTTGFFNSRDTVEVIWLAQAGAVVLGHIVSVLLMHAMTVKMFADRRQALLGQLPLALFTLCYTFFGLWLLASPRGA